MVQIPNPFSQDLDTLSKDDLLDWYSSEVFPPLQDDRKGSVYRRMILRRFWEWRGDNQPRELGDGTPYRAEDMSRLDRAINDVAEAHNRYENTV
jgi:hypothetical protein